MKIVLHGKLKEAFGDSFQIYADSVEDALRAISTQTPDWPEDLLIDVPGFDTVEKLKAKTDAEEIHLIPAIMGGGGKFGQIIIGAALIAFAVFNPLGSSALIVNFALAAGTSMALSGIMQLFMKAPKISRSNDPAASKYLGLNKNTTAIGTPIKLAWGTIPPGGHYLSIQSNADNLAHATWPTTPS